MILHDPHADYTDRNDSSTAKVLNAARQIIISIHTLSVSSFDLSLLPSRVILYWLSTARILMRLYRTLTLDEDNMEQAQIIGNEIDAIV
jgi:hypothetical protein